MHPLQGREAGVGEGPGNSSVPQQEGGAHGPLQAQMEASAGLCGGKEGGGMKMLPGQENIVGCLENI